MKLKSGKLYYLGKGTAGENRAVEISRAIEMKAGETYSIGNTWDGVQAKFYIRKVGKASSHAQRRKFAEAKRARVFGIPDEVMFNSTVAGLMASEQIPAIAGDGNER